MTEHFPAFQTQYGPWDDLNTLGESSSQQMDVLKMASDMNLQKQQFPLDSSKWPLVSDGANFSTGASEQLPFQSIPEQRTNPLSSSLSTNQYYVNTGLPNSGSFSSTATQDSASIGQISENGSFLAVQNSSSSSSMSDADCSRRDIDSPLDHERPIQWIAASSTPDMSRFPLSVAESYPGNCAKEAPHRHNGLIKQRKESDPSLFWVNQHSANTKVADFHWHCFQCASQIDMYGVRQCAQMGPFFISNATADMASSTSGTPAAESNIPRDNDTDATQVDELDSNSRDIKLEKRYETSDSKAKFLLEARKRGWPYKVIREKGGFKENLATLRGRYRVLTKPKHHRKRNAEWTEKDINLLNEAVRHFATKRKEVRTKQNMPWQKISNYILEHGGSYPFGNATCKRKYLSIQESENRICS